MSKKKNRRRNRQAQASGQQNQGSAAITVLQSPVLEGRAAAGEPVLVQLSSAGQLTALPDQAIDSATQMMRALTLAQRLLEAPDGPLAPQTGVQA